MKLTKKQLELLNSLNITTTELFDGTNQSSETNAATTERTEWEAQSLLTCLTWPLKEVTGKTCIRCGQQFLTGYDKVAYCSNICTELDLKEHYGIWWQPKNSFYEQWGPMEPPLLIGPRQIQAMRDLLSLLDQESPDQTDNQEQDSEGGLKLKYHYASLLPDLPIPDTEAEILPEHSEPDQDFLKLLEAFRDE